MSDADLLVVGGTGLAGRSVVSEALSRGLRVRVLSRRLPGADAPGRIAGAEYLAGDIRSGVGLREALAGTRGLIDTTNGFGRAARSTLTDGARRLTDAAAAAGLERAVLLSIVNVDRGRLGYYRAKAEQERVYLGADLDARVVRATQFHEFVAALCHLAPFGLATAIHRARFQPIAVDDVAAALVNEAVGPDAPARTVVIGGPLVQSTRELATLWQRARGRPGPVIPVPLPGQMGRFFRAGLNLVPESRVGTVSFEEWLAGR